MQLETRKIKDLKYYIGNPRKISREMLNRLRDSIEKFGLVEPLVVNLNNEVIGGNQRLRALIELRIEETPVVVVDLPKDKEKALNLALNKIQGEWDEELLKEFVEGLEQSTLLDVGFTLEEIGSFPADSNLDFDNEEPLKEEGEIIECPKCGFRWKK